VKRSLVLTAVLSLAAVPLFGSSASAQTPSIARATVGITIKVSPTRDRTRPYTFTTTGRIIPPTRFCAPGVDPTPGAGNCIPVRCPVGTTDPVYCEFPPRAVICSGVVNVRFQSRGTTISSRNVNVRSNCTYRSRVTFRTRLALRRGRFTVRARFQGNAVLRPRTSRTRIVRAG